MFTPVGSELAITFDRPLEAAALDTGNWFLRYGDMRYTIVDADASGDEVTLIGMSSVFDSGPDVVSYSPPPFDVRSMEGAAAGAFNDFPVAPGSGE